MYIKAYSDWLSEKEDHPYYKGISKSTAAKKKAQMAKQAEKPDDDPEAYKELPGDEKGKKQLKTSKHTKAYHELYDDESIEEKKPAGAPDWHDSDAPDAEGRFKDLGIKDLAAWLIKTRNKDLKKISGSITQQIVFRRKKDPEFAEKMEKVRQEVYRQLGREDLLDK